MRNSRFLFLCLFFPLIETLAQSVWTPRNPGTLGYRITSVTWSGTQLVAVTDLADLILLSPDGTTWTKRNTGNYGPLHSVTWTGNQLVAVGPSAAILTSGDGVTWTKRHLNQPEIKLNSVTWASSTTGPGAGQLVAVGYDFFNIVSVIKTSPDGINWTNRTGSSVNLKSVVWTGPSTSIGITREPSSGTGQFVAVGEVGAILTSSDGIAWAHTSGSTDTLNSVTWTGSTIGPGTGQLVAVGYDGFNRAAVVKTSPNGMDWTSRNLNGTPSLNSVTWTGKQLVAVGDSGTILTSLDGIAWTSRNSGTTNNLYSVNSTGIGSGLLVVVGDAGTILTSPEDPVSSHSFMAPEKSLSLWMDRTSLYFASQPFTEGNYWTAIVYSLSGREASRYRLTAGENNEQKIDVGHLVPGLYLFEIKNRYFRQAKLFTITQ